MMEKMYDEEAAFDEWAIIELFGHQKMAGHVTQAPIGDMLRVDVHEDQGKILFTRFVNPKAIYAINPCSQEVAIAVGKKFAQPPVTRWELGQLQPAPSPARDHDDDDLGWDDHP